MYLRIVSRAALSACLFGAAACSSATLPEATLALSSPADFAATATKVEVESGSTPGGGFVFSQHDVWVVIPPASSTNADVTVADRTPVFVRSGSGRITASSPNDIRAGDSIEVWHDATVGYFTEGYGAVQSPRTAVYQATQIVIDR